MSTVVEKIATVEGLQVVEQELAKLRRRHTEIDATLDAIADATRRGDTNHVCKIAGLRAEQAELEGRIREQENILTAQHELVTAAQRAVREKEREQVFSEMRATRQEIGVLGRQMSLLLARLHGELLQRGEKLVPCVVGNLHQQEFVRLLAPVDPCNEDREWFNHHREMPGVGYEHVVRIRPMQEL